MSYSDTDTLHISAIRAYGYTGALPEENTLGQWFEVDLTLWCDLSIAAQSDRLEDAVDYSTLVPTVQHLVATARFKLIETLATAIADTVLQQDAIAQVTVRLTKCTPPVPNFSGTVAVTISRSRDASR